MRNKIEKVLILQMSRWSFVAHEELSEAFSNFIKMKMVLLKNLLMWQSFFLRECSQKF